MRSPLKKPPAISGPLTAALLPSWAKKAAATGPARLTQAELANLIEKARTWPLLVWEGESSPVFGRLAEAARKAWARRGRVSDQALRVVYELGVLVPALVRERWVEQIPELRWFVEAHAALIADPELVKRTDRLLPRQRGAPTKGRRIGDLFDVLRESGYSYSHAVDAVREVEGAIRQEEANQEAKEPTQPTAEPAAQDDKRPSEAAVEQAVRRVKKSRSPDEEVTPEEESEVAPCSCSRRYPYCESSRIWFSAQAKWRRKQLGRNPRTGRPFHLCGERKHEPRSVDATGLICKIHQKCDLVSRKAGEEAALVCPTCGKGRAEVGMHVVRPLPHHHCLICDRPHPVKGGPPILRPVGMNAWACNDNPNDTAGCLALARRTLLVSEKAQRGRRKKGAQTPPRGSRRRA